MQSPTENKVITIDDQIQCVSREIGMRLMVYPSLIVRKRISAEKAEFEQRCMEAVLETLRQVKAYVKEGK